MHRKIHLVNGKLIKPKYTNIEPENETLNDKSVTINNETFVEDRPPEVQVMGNGFNYNSITRPISSMKKQTESVAKRANPDLVSGLGLLKFSTPSIKTTKSKNIKIIV